MSFATRFAPSPTGALHKGHAYSAVVAWRAAQVAGGRFILRIEDTDFTRCRPEHEAGIYEDLAWLGLDWEVPVLRQSDHRADYEAAIQQLGERGLLYRCFRTRKEQAALARDGDDGSVFRGGPHELDEEAAFLAEGRPFAWRLSLAAARDHLGDLGRLTWIEEDLEPGLKTAVPERLGDMVIGRKDIGAGYVIASVIDDARQGISHVIRGVDLADMTSIQRVLQALLDLPTPTYRHHPLVLDETGQRLAKRKGSPSLKSLRESGMSAADLLAEFGL
ncbi:tRNA glutamyl-Q(34) synthetase GluQRS [Brevundimonas aveniformis]|uniref:tRNA glutamyl-Q(34) synthetase GluQRS n=1 Tax=Brevundimonas aveniformis TaxID=370977 RepID=UPI0024904F58|nr:tRNA glutamyl-Q(34) synthetase GluQRS [Brevundimonas aveniformis]